jgi:hypothetical protein
VSDAKLQKKATKELPEPLRKAVAAKVEAFIARELERSPKATLRQIADKHGVPQGMLSAMRNGNGIGIMTLIRLRKLTQLTIDDLLGLDPLTSDIERAVAREIDRRSQPPRSEPLPKGPTPNAPPSRPRRRP